MHKHEGLTVERPVLPNAVGLFVFCVSGRIAELHVRRCDLLLQTEHRGLSVGLSVTIVSPAIADEPIEISFGMRTQVGPRKYGTY